MAETHQRAQNIPKGIVYMLGAAAVFPVMNAGAKYLSQYYPIPEVIWARTTGQLLFMMAVFLPSRGTRLFATAHLPYQLLCSVMMICATVLFFIGVAYVPLAEAQAVTFTSPLIVALLAFPLLRERVTVRRWATILVGFAGTLIVIRPGSEIANLGALLVFLNTIFYAVYQVLTRILGGFDRPETTVTYSALTGTIALSMVIPFVWTPPQSFLHVLIFLSLGLLGGFGHYCVTKALSYGPASVISPFNYGQLLGAAILGFLVFDAVPAVWTWVGSAIIIASGLSMVYGESFGAKRKR
jgi:drug/metabolite transporter (DMT)-like permease